MKQIKLTVDGQSVTARSGQTILRAALEAGLYIPHLCDHPNLQPAGECKLCVVEIEGNPDCVTSCSTPAMEGMVVTTKSQRLLQLRQLSMELMMASHPPECTACPKYLKCELQSLTQYLGISSARMKRLPGNETISHENPLVVRDLTRCVLCGRCVRACQELRGADVLDYHREGEKTWIAPKTGSGLLKDGGCRFCGACVAVCPTGAIRDKDEVFAGFATEEQALVPCRAKCPAGVDVPRYLARIRERDYAAALAVIREKVPFPLTLGYICMHFCEDVCRRGELGGAVSIRELKKFAADCGGNDWKAKVATAPPTGHRIAVIGSGPAGLTCAYLLARRGHSVDVFEKLSVAGGMLRVGIPSYRLPTEVLGRELGEVLESGVRLHLSQEAEAPELLLSSGYDAVIVAIGAHQGKRLPIPGRELPGVLTAVDFLRQAATGETTTIGRRVVVLGGGNVAFDCAGTARRLGAESVTVACLEPRDKMTASEEEVQEALAEGVTLLNSRTFSRIEPGGPLTVMCEEVERFSFEGGQLQVVKQPDSEHSLAADTVIFASGQRPICPEEYHLPTSPQGLLDKETGLAGVFVAGDAVLGTSSVIQAIASGRDAARCADLYLGGDGEIDERPADVEQRNPWLGPDPGFAARLRFTDKSTDGSEEALVCEAGRCLQCDLRLDIEKVKFWNEYAAR